MQSEYKVTKGIGRYWNQRWELRKKYTYYAKAGDIEPTEYEQRRKETKANGFEMLPFMA